jgi:hypothetical protein
MEDAFDVVLTKDGLQVLAIANIAVEKLEPAYRLKPRMVRRCTWASEIVENDNTLPPP